MNYKENNMQVWKKLITWNGPPPKVTCLCGSTRFKKAFEAISAELTLNGHLVISVGMFGQSGQLSPEECETNHPTKMKLDELHKRKIDLADEIFVINVDGYIGESTRSEIEYAKQHGKHVNYMNPIML